MHKGFFAAMAVAVIFVSLSVYLLFEVKSLENEKAQLNSELSQSKLLVENLRSSNDNLTTNLEKKTVEFSAAEDEYSNYHSTVKKYFQLSRTINDDAKVMAATVLKLLDAYQMSAETQSLAQDYYDQLDAFQKHAKSYEELLKSERSTLENAGVDVDNELDALSDIRDKLSNLEYEIKRAEQ